MSNEVVAVTLWIFAALFGVGFALSYRTLGDLEDDERAGWLHRLTVMLTAGCLVGAWHFACEGLWVISDGAPSTYRLAAWLLVPLADRVALGATGLLVACIIGSVLFIRHLVGEQHGRRGAPPG